jgi:hypothetical protein
MTGQGDETYQVPLLQPPPPVQVRSVAPVPSRAIVKVLFAPAVVAFDTAVTEKVFCPAAVTSASPAPDPYVMPVLPSSACESHWR